MLVTMVVRTAPYTGAACGGRLYIPTTNTFSAAGQGPRRGTKHGKYYPLAGDTSSMFSFKSLPRGVAYMSVFSNGVCSYHLATDQLGLASFEPPIYSGIPQRPLGILSIRTSIRTLESFMLPVMSRGGIFHCHI
jgi:hypothetical protein